MAMFEKIIAISWTKIISKMKKTISVASSGNVLTLELFVTIFGRFGHIYKSIKIYWKCSPSAIDSIAIRSKSDW